MPVMDEKEVFFALDATPEMTAYVEEMGRQGWFLAECRSGWTLQKSRLIYGLWYTFRPVR
jgi:hypothetical protein